MLRKASEQRLAAGDEMSCADISGHIILDGGIAKAKSTRKETWSHVLRTSRYGKEEKERRSGWSRR